jgi:hypothetical protein
MEEDDIFKDYELKKKSFEDPLQNEFFKYHLNNNVKSYDPNRLSNDPSYSKTLYDDYINYLVECCHRPTFPPAINIEEYVNENENNKKIKDMSKMNKGNSFMVYRKYLHKHMQISGINFPMKQLSQLASTLWKSEPIFVKDYYRELSERIQKLHYERLGNLIVNGKRKRSPNDDDNHEMMNHKKIKDMTKKNGGNSFIIFRKKLNEYLKSIGTNLPMQKLSSLASYLWSRQPEYVKSQHKELSEQTKKLLNEQIRNLYYGQDDNGSSMNFYSYSENIY